MDEHKSKIVHKLVETLCLVMETPDSKMDKISEDIVPKSTFTSLKEGMDMKEDDNIFSKMKFGDKHDEEDKDDDMAEFIDKKSFGIKSSKPSMMPPMGKGKGKSPMGMGKDESSSTMI